MRGQYLRALLGVSIALVMMGLRSEAGTAQGGLAVTPRTATYPGAPRSVAVVDVTMPSGQHLWFDTDLCRTFAWLDTDNTTTLSNPVAAPTTWPPPDQTVYYQNFGSTYSEPGGMPWSQFNTTSRPHFQGYTTTSTSITFTCDYAWNESPDAQYRYTMAITYTNAQRPTGTGYILTASPSFPANCGGNCFAVNQQTGLGGIGGTGTGLTAWSFGANGDGVKAFPYLHGVALSYTCEFWCILTHPQGTVVVMEPNLYGSLAFTAVTLTSNADQGFTAAKQAGNPATDGLAFLFTRAPGRTDPQQYLDARYALMRDWYQSLGLGPQHMTPAKEGFVTGIYSFDSMRTPGSWSTFLAWGGRNTQMAETIGQYVTTNGLPSGITGATDLESEMYWPAASDLPGIVPAPNGQTYTYGTLAALRQGLDLMRILGIGASYWSQWGYPNGNLAATRISHFNLSSHRSVFFDLRPDLVSGCPGNCQIDFTNPNTWQWMKDWSTQYWLSQGMHGKFMDSSLQIPAIGDGTAPAGVEFNVWYRRQGGFIKGETARPWLGPLYYNGGGAFQVYAREWGVPFTESGTNWRLCFGAADWLSQQICEQITPDISAGVGYDPVIARRLHAVGAGWNAGAADKYQWEADRDATLPGHSAAMKTEALKYSAMQDKYGQPDRVELVNPTPVNSIPYPLTLGSALSPTVTTASGLNEVWVSVICQLPGAGVLQIGSEQILYTVNNSDGGLTQCVGAVTGVVRGYNGTTAAAHSQGAAVSLISHNPLWWTFDDAYWVYGTGSNEVWVRYSDGSVWQTGGTASGALPTITAVAIAATGGTTPTVSWTTDRPASSWVEYDTFGTAEASNPSRPAGWWPNYLHKTNLADLGAPDQATAHNRILPALTPGALYHYSIVARGPAQSRTADSTFIAGAQATYSISASPSTVAPGGTVTLTIHDGAPAAWHAWGRLNQTTTEWGFLDCGQTGPNPPGLTDATCALPAPAAPGTYTYGLFDSDPARTMLAQSTTVTVVAPTTTPTPTRTATPVPPTATRTATLTPSATPTATPTPVQCIQVRLVNGGEVAEPCP